MLTGYSYTNLLFFDGAELGLSKTSVLYGSDFVLSPRAILSFGAGAVFFGELDVPPDLGRGNDLSLAPGWIGTMAATFRVVEDEGALPYVLLTPSAGVLHARTRERPTEAPGLRGAYTGVDLRFGVTVGKTFANTVSPYVAARVFGGPILWSDGEDTTLGSDLYHFQPALGLAVVLPQGVDLFAEWQPWFERGFTLGMGLRN